MILKPQSFVSLLTGLAVSLGVVATFPQTTVAENLTQKDTFFCDYIKNEPVTFIRGTKRDYPLIRWTDRSFPPPWDAEKRCKEISLRLQQFYDNKVLDFLAAKMWRGQPVLCITNAQGGTCRDDGLLVTLKPGTDLQRTLQRLRRNLEGGAVTPDELSGDGITYINGEAYLDVNKVLPDDERLPRILK